MYNEKIDFANAWKKAISVEYNDYSTDITFFHGFENSYHSLLFLIFIIYSYGPRSYSECSGLEIFTLLQAQIYELSCHISCHVTCGGQSQNMNDDNDITTDEKLCYILMRKKRCKKNCNLGE
ncbi:unnamed protein product [Owenia fusiformis]|uniref:Uncharacterized protein n=1 Tax=Owenia fusiformis TaxID=6347 RepID=A0A8S4PRV2_OWEFU|nr:unnamed protein product [Owenia fusiformis]